MSYVSDRFSQFAELLRVEQTKRQQVEAARLAGIQRFNESAYDWFLRLSVPMLNEIGEYLHQQGEHGFEVSEFRGASRAEAVKAGVRFSFTPKATKGMTSTLTFIGDADRLGIVAKARSVKLDGSVEESTSAPQAVDELDGGAIAALVDNFLKSILT